MLDVRFKTLRVTHYTNESLKKIKVQERFTIFLSNNI